MKIPGIPNHPDAIEFGEKECLLILQSAKNSLDLINSIILDFISKKELIKLFWGLERTTHLLFIPSPIHREVFGLIVSNELDKTKPLKENKDKIRMLKNILEKLKYNHKEN